MMSLAMMKVKTPKVRLGNIIKNTNFGPYKFDAGIVTFLYQSVIVGQVAIPKSKARMLSTKKIDVELPEFNSKTLNGTNYIKWRQDIEIALRLMGFDLALWEKEPAKPADDAPADKKNEYEKWIKANREALLVIKRSMSDLFRGAITESDNAKAYHDSIEVKFKESKKAEKGTLMNTLNTTK
ncbi:hypothetical protein D8674_011878 [Pyrus ussuriensis x Pyrus communis]|uniref:Retrotransposon Copia-like N-terminal domain-containing protein n=1 Tax=Pyrus ussuriensis x Pyrus communis TaxID=2448454 RepID=A0A5N5G4R8_9ROSA|nr:hypothetical protein D8674_011878 [Pyrus ussuriensis x Pyrus communis]